MITPIFHGTVNKGTLQVEPRFYSYLGSLEGQKVEVVVRKRRSKRSDQQNRYWWGVVIQMLSDHCGYTPQDMHDTVKCMFLSSNEKDEFGLIKIGSTASLSKDEFSLLTNKVVRWAAENLSLYIPDPNQVDY